MEVLYWKIFEKWASKIFLVLSLAAMGFIVYLLILENKSSVSYDSSQDLPDRIIQVMMCPSLMVKDELNYVGVSIQNTDPELGNDVTVSINAPNFNIVQPKETSTVVEDLSSSWFGPEGWLVAPTQTGKHTITFSAVTDDGMTNAVTCEITVIYFLGLDLKIIYGICIFIFYIGFYWNLRLFREKRKQKEMVKKEEG